MKCCYENSALESLVEEEYKVFNLVTDNKSLLNLSALESTESRLENVFNQIDNTSLEIPVSNSINNHQSFIGKIKSTISSWLPTTFGVTEYARFASVALLVISLSVLMAFVAPLFTEKNDFTPAAAKSEIVNNKQSTTILLVGTNGSLDSLRSLPQLKGKLKKVESVQGKKGMYKISFNKKLSNTQVKEVLSSLSSNKELIWFAGEAF